MGNANKQQKRKYRQGLYAQAPVKGKGNSKHGAFQVEPGMQGIYAFIHLDKERGAVAELRSLFEEYAEKIYGTKIKGAGASDDLDDSDDDDAEDVADVINRQLKELKSETNEKKAQFYWCKTNIDCIVFLRTFAPIEPADFVHKIFQDLNEKKLKKTRYTSRLHPVQHSCKAYMDDIKALAKTAVAPFFHQEGQKGIQWAVEPRIKWNDSIKRDDLIKEIADIVGAEHFVNLKSPELTVVIDIFKNVCALSVVRDYPEFKKYNLEKLVETPADATPSLATPTDPSSSVPVTTTTDSETPVTSTPGDNNSHNNKRKASVSSPTANGTEAALAAAVGGGNGDAKKPKA
ncbi:uncharacterized protein EV422DRAFT_328622 [Fimicolochytrium jonesii]|uniref:uncharacterized protein n=1 Tax=Fimicolochytrium jonesii TaxID=1396493 RepID=UPI0022FF1F9B|nr:uncharacterized protein EV422DRAFT_328622 [Fimicolochytrium jonesii]KAI8816165.1 hypothetical protein EV422DRAFT_328622 [Fimicolochytrium jonesii]